MVWTWRSERCPRPLSPSPLRFYLPRTPPTSLSRPPLAPPPKYPAQRLAEKRITARRPTCVHISSHRARSKKQGGGGYVPGTTARTGTTSVRGGGGGRPRSGRELSGKVVPAASAVADLVGKAGTAGGTLQEWAGGSCSSANDLGHTLRRGRSPHGVACVGRQTARDPGFSVQLQLWGLAQIARNDACCLARSSEQPDQSNGLCFRPKWTFCKATGSGFFVDPGAKKAGYPAKFSRRAHS